MAKILLINPNKWGRGVTSIWIASHSALLKENGHEVDLFDATFYSQWTVDEVSYNTDNEQYLPTDYHGYVNFKETPILDDLQKKDGKTIIMVEQNAKKGLAFADIGYVLVSGETAIAETGDNVLSNPEVGRLFLGG